MALERSTVVRVAEDCPVSETVIFAVATARNVNPIELETPLYDVIDTDALDRLFPVADDPGRRVDAHVEFTWARCRVDVFGSGRVVVVPPATEGTNASALVDT